MPYIILKGNVIKNITKDIKPIGFLLLFIVVLFCVYVLYISYFFRLSFLVRFMLFNMLFSFKDCFTKPGTVLEIGAEGGKGLSFLKDLGYTGTPVGFVPLLEKYGHKSG